MQHLKLGCRRTIPQDSGIGWGGLLTKGEPQEAAKQSFPCHKWAEPAYRSDGFDKIAQAAFPVQGTIACFFDSPWSLAPVQVLDGIETGLMNVTTPNKSELLFKLKIMLGLAF